MAQAGPDTLRGARDRAVLLLGFAGAFRRSELVALNVSDLEETEERLRVTIRKSKTACPRYQTRFGSSGSFRYASAAARAHARFSQAPPI
jgi:integrase